MKILTALLSLGLLAFLGHETVTLHKRTVCRQEAWRAAVRQHTRTLLSRRSPNESDPVAWCRILVSRNNRRVVWKRFPSPRQHPVSLNLRGSL